MEGSKLYLALAAAVVVVFALFLSMQNHQEPEPQPAIVTEPIPTQQLQPPLVAEPAQTANPQNKKHHRKVKKVRRKAFLKKWNNMTPEQRAAYRQSHPNAKLPPEPIPGTSTKPAAPPTPSVPTPAAPTSPAQ